MTKQEESKQQGGFLSGYSPTAGDVQGLSEYAPGIHLTKLVKVNYEKQESKQYGDSERIVFTFQGLNENSAMAETKVIQIYSGKDDSQLKGALDNAAHILLSCNPKYVKDTEGNDVMDVVTWVNECVVPVEKGKIEALAASFEAYAAKSSDRLMQLKVTQYYSDFKTKDEVKVGVNVLGKKPWAAPKGSNALSWNEATDRVAPKPASATGAPYSPPSAGFANKPSGEKLPF